MFGLPISLSLFPQQSQLAPLFYLCPPRRSPPPPLSSTQRASTLAPSITVHNGAATDGQEKKEGTRPREKQLEG